MPNYSITFIYQGFVYFHQMKQFVPHQCDRHQTANLIVTAALIAVVSCLLQV